MPEYHGVQYTINKRASAWQYNVVTVEGGIEKRHRRQEPTYEAAEATVKTIIDRSREGMPGLPPTARQFATPTLQRVYELIRDGRWKGSKGEVTSRKNAEDCIAFLGANTPIDGVTTEQIDALITHLKDRELEPGTIRRKLAALSTVIKYAAERHWIKAVPIIDRSAAGKERKRLRFLSQEEEDNLLKFLREFGSEVPGMGKYTADFFALLIDTGLRLTEALTLKWSDIEADKNGVARAIRLGFDNKGEEPRLVPCTDRVVGILKARKDERQTGERLVWGKMNASRAGYFWNLARAKLGLVDDVDFVIHACRHTFASRLAMQGVPLNVIKELGGWKTLEMVLRYAHLSPQQKEDAIRKMQQWGRDAAAG